MTNDNGGFSATPTQQFMNGVSGFGPTDDAWSDRGMIADLVRRNVSDCQESATEEAICCTGMYLTSFRYIVNFAVYMKPLDNPSGSSAFDCCRSQCEKWVRLESFS